LGSYRSRGCCFHSISFPSEWGLAAMASRERTSTSFHSISFPSEWGHQPDGRSHSGGSCFHSISFPSEWGQQGEDTGSCPWYDVSIQLVSPASGDFLGITDPKTLSTAVSIQLVSPASGDKVTYTIPLRLSTVSIQLVSPASGDSNDVWQPRFQTLWFPFN